MKKRNFLSTLLGLALAPLIPAAAPRLLPGYPLADGFVHWKAYRRVSILNDERACCIGSYESFRYIESRND